MFRDKIRCPICRKELQPYTTIDDTKQTFVLMKEDCPLEQPIRVFVYTCSTCGNIQLFGVI